MWAVRYAAGMLGNLYTVPPLTAQFQAQIVWFFCDSVMTILRAVAGSIISLDKYSQTLLCRATSKSHTALP